MKYPKRKDIRLNRDLYNGPLIISVTLCFHQNKDIIKDGLADKIICILKNITSKYTITNYAYCLMPNHLHWLLGLPNDKYNVLDVIKHFKSRVSIDLKERCSVKTFWQDRFYDHILRKEEDVSKHAKYILENPVRKNLAGVFTSYKYSGGICFEEYQRT